MNKPTTNKEHKVLITVPSHVKSFSVSYLNKFGTKVSRSVDFMSKKENKEKITNITNALIEDTHQLCKTINSFKNEGLGKAIIWSLMSNTKQHFERKNEQ